MTDPDPTIDDGPPKLGSLGPFDLVRPLGGHPATAWLAVDRREDMVVTLKLAPARGPCAERAREAFERERAAAAAHDIEGIPKVRAVGSVEGLAYLSRDYAAGITFADWIAARRLEGRVGPGAAEEALTTLLGRIAALARIVDRLHAAGWIHADIKPSNGVIGADGRCSLLDLGAAARIGGPLAPLATIAYAAPERHRDATLVAAPTLDVWSLGAVLLECLSGARPFTMPTAAQTIQRIVHRTDTDLRRATLGLSPAWRSVVLWALAPKPHRRCPSAAAFAEAVEAAAARGRSRAADSARRGRQARALTIRAGLVAALCAAGVGLAAAAGFTGPLGQPSMRVTRAWLDAAERDAAHVCSAWPRRIEAMQAWLADHATPLAARRDVHRQQPGIDPRLMRRLDGFLDAPDGAVARMRAQITRAERVARISLEDHRDAWRAAIGRVAADHRFDGFVLPRRIGLVPLGPDPASGLEEFHHLATATSCEHTPRRAPSTGRLEVDDDHGIVFVLVPGGTVWIGEQPDRPEDPLYHAEASAYSEPETVTLAPFLIAKHELSLAQWIRLGGAPPTGALAWALKPEDRERAEDRRLPACALSWATARRVVLRAGLDLPTECQWEHAATARPSAAAPPATSPSAALEANCLDASYRRYYGLPARAGDEDGHAFLVAVHDTPANRFGLHGVDGNVSEWCRDAFAPYDTEHLPRAGDGLRRASGATRILRGGAFDVPRVRARPRRRWDLRAEDRSIRCGVRPIARWMVSP